MVVYRFVPSPFGELALLWVEREDTPQIIRILIPKPDRDVRSRLSDCPQAVPGRQAQIDLLSDAMARFLEGEAVRLSLDLLDRSVCSPFQWRVLSAEYQIPRGEVRSYRQLATALGNPSGARAVGNALARNPFPIVIPCHRAIRADGSLGGYQGGAVMKRALLEMEGVRFDEQGRVVGQGRAFIRAPAHTVRR